MGKEKQQLDSLYISANSILERESVVISVSPTIDLILGGGIPEGSFVILTGPPKCGKSTSCLQFASNAQQEQFGNRDVFYFNIEGRLKKRDLLGIHGLNISNFNIIESKPGDMKYAEDYINIGEQLINEKPKSIFIFDSFSQLCTKSRRQSEIGDRFRDDTPLLLANFCKRICNVIPINNSIVIGITHLIANQGGLGYSPWAEASGQKVQYQVDVKLRATHKTPWKINETQIGQDVHWKCETSAIGPPGGECVSKLRYGYGLDKESELIELASDFGIIKKVGSWYTFMDGQKAQGLENARNILFKTPLRYNEIYDKLRTMLNLTVKI